MKKTISSLVLISLVFFPAVGLAYGFTPTQPGGQTVATAINNIIGWVLGLLIAFAVIMLIVAGYYFVSAQGDTDKVKTARNFVVYAIIGVIVGVLAYTLVRLGAFGIGGVGV